MQVVLTRKHEILSEPWGIVFFKFCITLNMSSQLKQTSSITDAF